MDLQDHFGAHLFAAHPVVDVDHRLFHNVGGGALNGHIDGHALGGGAGYVFGGVDVGQVAAAAQQGFGVLGAAGFGFDRFQVAVDAGVARQVGINEVAAFLAAEARLLGNAVGAQAVDDAEVEDFGDAALFGVDLVHGGSEHLAGGGGVNVLAPAEGVQQGSVLGQVGQHAQFDLGVVGRQETAAGVGDESPPHLPAQFGADGYVLQVGFAAADASGGGAGLVIGGMDAPGAVVHHFRQGVDVG